MIKRITAASFSGYGRVIEHPHKRLHGQKNNLFHIVLRELGRVGWRIAYLIIREKTIARLEYHPGSYESFEPVFGRSLLFVARKRDPRAITCFYLDRPVVLHKNIWHGVITVTKESEIKITENASIRCVYWPLGFLLDARKAQVQR